MTAFLCVTCGTQYPPSEVPPRECPICEDERQFVGFDGQTWTTLDELRATHRNDIIPLESGLTALLTNPAFAVGERALLVESPGGNVLWDCIALVDEPTVQAVLGRGQVKCIAISHPHYYTTMVECSRALGDIPVYLHENDREWVMRPDPCLRFWSGDTLALHDGMTLIRGGGHFPGGAMLHWPARGGALLSGDIIQVGADRRSVSFMHSYVNYIPLDAATVRSVVASVEPFAFNRIYGAFHPREIVSDAKQVIQRSMERYLRFIGA